jgi:hypothetical protein
LRHELEVVLVVFLTEELLFYWGFPRWVTWWGMPGAITRANRAMVGN